MIELMTMLCVVNNNTDRKGQDGSS